MRNENDINSIIAAFLSDEANEEDLKILGTWKTGSKENELLLNHLQKIWKEKNAEPVLPNYQNLTDRIWQKGQKRQ